MKSYKIKIELTASKPLIWRRVIIPAGATFNRLHDVIQNVTNFQSGNPYEPYHLFKYDLKEENLSITNDGDAYDENKLYKLKYRNAKLGDINDPLGIIAHHLKIIVRQPQSIKIDRYIEKYGKLNYKYDFGDEWQILIKLEETIEDYYYGYPTLIDGAENAPPEDVGGLPGYYEFLRIYHDDKHSDHEDVKAWAKEQGYREYDKNRINSSLKFIK